MSGLNSTPGRRAWPTRPAIFGMCLATAVLAGAGAASAQGARTVRDGVYSTVQAERGKEAFQAHCSACHGADMGGTDGAPKLFGGLFMLHWGDKPASEVHAMMRKSMPPTNPGGLPGETYVDILAAIFQANGFPARDEAKLTEDGLKDITIARKAP